MGNNNIKVREEVGRVDTGGGVSHPFCTAKIDGKNDFAGQFQQFFVIFYGVKAMQTLQFPIPKWCLLTLIFSVSGGAMPLGASPTLTPQQQEEFRADYLEGCLAGVAAENIDTQRGQAFCLCTVDRLSQLPASKLLALSEMSEQEIMANGDFKMAMAQCSFALVSHSPSPSWFEVRATEYPRS